MPMCVRSPGTEDEQRTKADDLFVSHADAKPLLPAVFVLSNKGKALRNDVCVT